MRSWVANAAMAARISADRAELWVPGALVWLATVGWLPLLLTVATFPAEADLAFFGAGLVTSGAWPLNAAVLGVAGVLVVLVGFALAALGEAALRRGVERSSAPLAAHARRLMVAALIGAVPVVLALLALGIALSAVAPDEFQSPDIGGEVVVRIAGRVAPVLVVLVLAVLAGEVIGATFSRRVTGPDAGRMGAALRAAVGDVRRSWLRLIGVAVCSLAGTVAYLVAATLLLRVLWAPIAAPLAVGQGIDAPGVLLLVGFVAIWLCLLLGGGALHAWASTWWTLELAEARRDGAERSRNLEAITPA
ncbi:MAG: hypothetical protein ACRDGV_11510 [Candidatus Limnocylindria bacterium]